MKKLKSLLELEHCNYEFKPINSYILSLFDPPIGYEYGFNKYGLRLSLNELNILKSVNKWDINLLSQLVDVITWSNCGDPEFDRILADEDINSDKLNLTGLGNLAYMAINASDDDIKKIYYNILLFAGKIKENN